MGGFNTFTNGSNINIAAIVLSTRTVSGVTIRGNIRRDSDYGHDRMGQSSD